MNWQLVSTFSDFVRETNILNIGLTSGTKSEDLKKCQSFTSKSVSNDHSNEQEKNSFSFEKIKSLKTLILGKWMYEFFAIQI